MEVKVRFLENLRLEASFDDFKITTDQPVRYKGDGMAPNPFDYFLASSALCAAYFVKVYCKARDLPTEDIKISQNNIVDPENRYNQIFRITAEIPESFSDKHRQGIINAMDRCTVKKVIQTGPSFEIDALASLGADDSLLSMIDASSSQTYIKGKDLALEETIKNMSHTISNLGIRVEVASWRNIVENVWSVHVRDAESPLCFTNGKGTTKESALASALGEYIERISCNYFYNDYYLGEEIASEAFVHYPNEKWFTSKDKQSLPEGLLDEETLKIYNPDGELRAAHLLDSNSGLTGKGVCAIPFIRESDGELVYFPVSLVGNLFVSNGMSAGNTQNEAKVQCLSEIFERAVKKQIIESELCLPCVPKEVLEKFPVINAGIKDLEAKGFPLLVKDASLGGKYPVMCIALMNPKTGGVFASFGAHPSFDVALERCLTELMQGRSFEGLNDVLTPTFNSLAIKEPNNFVEHFIDSNGRVSWKFFSEKSDFKFSHWDFSGTTAEELDYLLGILKADGREVYTAEYSDLGAQACRILVPGYSEIYAVDDLIWENTNRAIEYRESILNIHSLTDEALVELLGKFEDEGFDNYMMVASLIGIEFDENTAWGRLNIGELKLLICLAVGELEYAQELTKTFLNFNDNTKKRQLFYQAMEALLHIALDDDLELEDYAVNLSKVFGEDVVEDVVGLINGDVKFHGLTKTSMKLEGIEPHLKLVESYKKLHRARSNSKA
jgi:ribosomal protein S12 methylthiotransferase accessory factor